MKNANVVESWLRGIGCFVVGLMGVGSLLL